MPGSALHRPRRGGPHENPDAAGAARLMPSAGDALLMIDVQNDLLPGGSLAVPHGYVVVPALNWYIGLFLGRALPIYATRDWHPPDHCSFVTRRGRWPVHCVAGSAGADFAPGLEVPACARIVSKGTAAASRKSHSGFAATDLHARLRAEKVRRLFVGGLALEYAVLSTAKDALKLGYQIVLLADAVRAFNARLGDGARARREIAALGGIVHRGEPLARGPGAAPESP